MIYTVTFNPSLDYIVSVPDFQPGMTNRTESELLLPGGKGINVSVMLRNLGIENTALGFVAGFTGKEIVRRLEQMGVTNGMIFLEEGCSRINVKLTSIDGTEINGMGPNICLSHVEQLMERLHDLQDGDLLFLSGSIPAGMADDTYQQIMEALQDKNVMVVVDATKELLLKVLPYRPFLIKPNHHELGEIFGVTLSTQDEVIPYAKKLQDMGAGTVLVSMAGKGAVLLSETGEVLKSEAPKGIVVNSVGAGDSMVAGFMAGYLEQHDYETAFYMGLAAGSASAFSKQLATREEVEAVYCSIAAAPAR